MTKTIRRMYMGVVALIVVCAMVAISVPTPAYADAQSQTVKSNWTEVMNVEEGYPYDWVVRTTVTVTDGVVSGVVCSAKANGGGQIQPKHQPYYNIQHIEMETKLEDAAISAANPSLVDDVDVVSGATQTCSAIKDAVKGALVKWNDNMESVQPTVDLMNAIATASDKETAAIDARSSYNALSDDQKTYVPSDALKVLEDAENAIAAAKKAAADQAAADSVIEQLAALPSGNSATLEDKAAIEAARAAYDGLTDDQKALVDVSGLIAAEAKIAQLEKAAADKAAAESVSSQLSTLPAAAGIKLTDKAAVEAARAAYDALTDDQKALVDDSRLVAAEAKVAQLEKAAAEKAAAEKAAAEKAAQAAEALISNGSLALAKTSFTYTGKAIEPAIVVKTKSGKTLSVNTGYTVTYANNKNVGTATVTVKGAGSYTGTLQSTFAIAKATQPMTVKAKSPSVKAGKSLKKGKVFTVKNAKGAVTFQKASGNKKITVAKNGKVTVKKGLKANTYKIKVKVTAAGDKNYNAATKTVTVKVKVKK